LSAIILLNLAAMRVFLRIVVLLNVVALNKSLYLLVMLGKRHFINGDREGSN
jgi:hypothetical protein